MAYEDGICRPFSFPKREANAQFSDYRVKV